MNNIQNIDDNKCFKWCLVRYLDPADYHPARITKADKDFAKRLHFKDIKFPVKVRDFHKIKERIPLVLVVLVMKIKKKTFNLCIKKCCEEKRVDLLLIEEKGKRHYVPMKVFNTFMYNHTLHRRKKTFSSLLFTSF